MSTLNLRVPFDSRPIRIVTDSGNTLFALRDVCQAIGYSRGAAENLLKRNPRDFPSNICVLVTSTQIGPRRPGQNPTRPMIFLNEEDTVGFLMMLSILRVADPAKREKIWAFRAWAKRVIVDVLHGRIPEPLLDQSVGRLLELPAADRNAQIRLLAAQFGKTRHVIASRLRLAKKALASGKAYSEDFAADLRLAPLTPARILHVPAIRAILRAPWGAKENAYRTAGAALGLSAQTTRKVVRAARTGKKLPRQGHAAQALRKSISQETSHVG